MKLTRRFLALVIAVAGTGIYAPRADAAVDWWIEGVVATVALTDEVNNGGSGQSLDITFKEGYTGSWCNANAAYGGPGAAVIPASSTAVFADMVRTAQTALLSGKRLRIKSHTTTGSLAQCRVHYMQIK